LLGAGGALKPATFPSGWSQASTQVHRQEGPLLALPWHEYMNLSFANDRRVLNPVPDYFGGDVLASSNPEFADSPNAREQGDPREVHIAPLLNHLDHASDAFVALGIRWVVVLHEVDWHDYQAINRDPGMQHTLATPSLDLYRVRDWKGPIVDNGGRRVHINTVVQPWSWLSASGPATWTRPGLSGWLRGTSSTRTTATGLLRLPAGRGPVWYWPAALAIGADIVVIGGVFWAVRRGHRAERNDDPEPPLPQ
jgi:hypothetical protein